MTEQKKCECDGNCVDADYYNALNNILQMTRQKISEECTPILGVSGLDISEDLTFWNSVNAYIARLKEALVERNEKFLEKTRECDELRTTAGRLSIKVDQMSSQAIANKISHDQDRLTEVVEALRKTVAANITEENIVGAVEELHRRLLSSAQLLKLAEETIKKLKEGEDVSVYEKSTGKKRNAELELIVSDIKDRLDSLEGDLGKMKVEMKPFAKFGLAWRRFFGAMD